VEVVHRADEPLQPQKTGHQETEIVGGGDEGGDLPAVDVKDQGILPHDLPLRCFESAVAVRMDDMHH
jgi:hypothetical protein